MYVCVAMFNSPASSSFFFPEYHAFLFPSSLPFHFSLCPALLHPICPPVCLSACLSVVRLAVGELQDAGSRTLLH